MRHVDIEQLAQSSVEHAGLLLAPWTGTDCVLLDADGNRFVLAPAPPAGAEAAIGLTWDGTEIIYRGLRETFGPTGLCRQNLSSGDVRWHRSPSGEAVVAGAVSRDGQMAAILTTGVSRSFDGVRVHVVDMLSGEGRPLWSADGGVSAESGVKWSQDSSLVSATYFDVHADDGDGEEEWITVVLDLKGNIVANYPYSAALQAPNGAWLSDNQLVLYDDFDDRLRLCQPLQGTDRRVSLAYGVPVATCGTEILCGDDQGGHAPLTLIAASTDGQEFRELFQLTPNTQLRVVDVSGALDLGRLANGSERVR